VAAQHLLAALFNAGTAISVGATVLSLGMTFTVSELVAPLHRVVLVVACTKSHWSARFSSALSSAAMIVD
jgi:hypothetical protein